MTAAILAYALSVFVSTRLITGSISPDFLNGYHPGALGFQRGEGYVANGALITHWPPGYSLFAAPFVSDDPRASLRVLNHVNGLLAAVWIGLLAWLAMLVVPRIPLWVVLPLAAFWPPLLALGNPAGSEMLFTVLVTLTACLTVLLLRCESTPKRLGLALAAGVTLGLASLTRSVGVSLACAVVLSLLIAPGSSRRQRAASGLLVLASWFLTILPWVSTYQRHTGHVGFTSAGLPSVREGFRRAADTETGRELARRTANWRTAHQARGDLLELSWKRPLGMLVVLMTKASSAWYATDSGRFDRALRLVQLPWLFLFVLSGAALVIRPARAPPEGILLHAVVIAAWLTTIATLSIVRYLAPVFPLAVLGVLANLSLWLSSGEETEPDAAAPPEPLADELPRVTVVMPIRNEERRIAETLGAVLKQDYPPERLDVIVADGASTDGTRAIVESQLEGRSNLRLVENPARSAAAGLNLAIREALGDVIVRVDGHATVAPDYVRQSVLALERTGADNVGGPVESVGEGAFGSAVALAMSSPFGVGGARFRYSRLEEEVDTVPFGAWRREVFDRIGLFDEELVRNQDDEHNYRLRASGGRIVLSPRIRSVYTVRATPRSLWRQYYQYGRYKVRVLQKHTRQMRPRQFVPPLFVLTLLALGVVACLSPLGLPLLAGVGGAYLIGSLVAAAHSAGNRPGRLPLVMLAFATLHVAYGAGFLVGLVRFANRWRDRE